MDFLEVTVDYRMQARKGRTRSRNSMAVSPSTRPAGGCPRRELKGHDVLSLNLAHDIATGKKSVEDARKAFGEIVGEDMAGKYPPYTTKCSLSPSRCIRGVVRFSKL